MPDTTETDLDTLTAKNAELNAECERLAQELATALRSTPSVEASQIEDAHTCLDRFDVAREMRGRVLTLGDRVSEIKIDKSWYQVVRRAHKALDGCGCVRENDAGGVLPLDARIAAFATDHK